MIEIKVICFDILVNTIHDPFLYRNVYLVLNMVLLPYFLAKRTRDRWLYARSSLEGCGISHTIMYNSWSTLSVCRF